MELTMYRFSAINNINNNINLVVDNSEQPMYVMDMVEVGNVDGYAEGECGRFIVEDGEAAELALCRALGLPELQLYDDDKSPTTRTADRDRLAQLVELQLRMEKGMDMINEQTMARDVLREEYYGLKDRISRGFDMIKAETDKNKKTQLQVFMTKVVDEKNDVGATLGSTNDYLSRLWDHWKLLRNECKAIIGNDKTLWVAYFEIEDKEEWFNNYIDSDNWFDSVEFDTVEEVNLPVMAQNDRLALSREKWHVTSAKRLANI